jgi:Outer membrane cobalamin receptor protein
MPVHAPLVLAVAASLAASSSIAHAADVLAADAGPGRTLDAVQVTGSNIKRTDTETANPVQVIDREQIAASGKQTTAELLRSISANTGGGSNETQNSGWSSGAAGIGLRGLSSKNTLILLNGRRLANYGFPNGGLSDTFVNIKPCRWWRWSASKCSRTAPARCTAPMRWPAWSTSSPARTTRAGSGRHCRRLRRGRHGHPECQGGRRFR